MWGRGSHDSCQQGQVANEDHSNALTLGSPSRTAGTNAAEMGKGLNCLRLIFHTYKNGSSY